MFGWICSIIVIVTHDWVYSFIKNLIKNQEGAIPKELRL